MSSSNSSVLALLLASLVGCGQPLVEFGNPNPTVTSTDPTNASTGVGVRSTVNATFSERMDPATLSASSFTLQQGGLAISGTVTYAGMTATFTPTVDLAPNTFTATVSTGARSAASTIGLAADYTWTFTTVAGGQPAVTSTDPGNSYAGVVLSKQITANFSRAMDPATINGATFLLKQGTTPVSGTVSYAGTTARFIPASLLTANTAYDATITTGANDLAGLGIAANYKWSFTTGTATNVTPPSVTVVNPADGATGVCPNEVVQATFSGPMDPATMVAANFTLAAAAARTGAVSFDPASQVATFTPGSNLSTNTSYVATVTTGMKDQTGTPLAQNKVWRFTTGSTLCQAPVPLRSLSTFVAVAGAGLTNAGATILGGDVGLYPTATCTSDGAPCNPPGNAPKITGTLYAADPAGVASKAKADLLQAYSDAAGRPAGTPEADLSGLTLTPGVYTSGSTMILGTNATLILDAQGDANAVWIFQLGSALTVNAGAKVLLVNGAKAGNVTWAIGSSSTLGANVTFKGSILAQTANTVGTSTTVEGRLLCTSASITLLANTITLPAP
jgi:Ice-binding-like/Bacterial Ig-like domain